MPIGGVISQPEEGSINAAYRPVPFAVSATATNGDPVPPIVYCDIYINDLFYKSLSRTQYDSVDGGLSLWVFDIQDACQEFFISYISANGGSVVELADSVTLQVFCRFRSSGINDEGFTVVEDTAPIQGTWGVPSQQGTGTESNTVTVVMASLQHEQVQDLATHLDGWKLLDGWDAAVWPLTHRPERYKVCEEDSDFFPILSETPPGDLTIHYTNHDGTTGSVGGGVSTGGGGGGEPPPGCQGVGGGVPVFPTARVGVPYFYSFGLTGTAPFTLDSFAGPDFMSANIVGGSVQFTGTPTLADVETGFTIEFTVGNCTGASTRGFSGDIDIVPSENFVLSAGFNMRLETEGTDGSGAPALGPTPMNTNLRTHHTGVDGVVDVIVTGVPPLTLSIQATVNAVQTDCQPLPAAGTYSLDVPGATESDTVVIAVFSGTC